MTGNTEVMDQVGRRCPVGGNAVRRLFCMPLALGCSTASPRSQRKQLMAGGIWGERIIYFGVIREMFNCARGKGFVMWSSLFTDECSYGEIPGGGARHF